MMLQTSEVYVVQVWINLYLFLFWIIAGCQESIQSILNCFVWLDQLKLAFSFVSEIAGCLESIHSILNSLVWSNQLKLVSTFLISSAKVTFDLFSRTVGVGGAPDFDGSVTTISTREGRSSPHNITGPTRFSDLPTALSTTWIIRLFSLKKLPSLFDFFILMFLGFSITSSLVEL